MRHLLKVQDGGGQILNCATCTLPENSCPVCPVTTEEQPKMTPVVAEHLKLHKRLVRYPGTLPGLGGMDDQDERTMRILDVISDEVEASQRRKEKREAEKAKRSGSGRWPWRR